MKHGNDEIKTFILNNIENHSKDIASFTASEFGISRQAVLKHLHKLAESGDIAFSGDKNKRQYGLNDKILKHFVYALPGVDEADIYIKDILPLIKDVSKNVKDIIQYCFTEIVNNANDHSEGDELNITFAQTAVDIILVVRDNGIGIFKKIAKALNLSDERYAILELEKGKFTTDKARHTGEGIFFSSRLAYNFLISSGELKFHHCSIDSHDCDTLYESDSKNGTSVVMLFLLNTAKTCTEIFEKYADDDFMFTKTAMRVDLLRVGEENLVSRSQAKRLLARFEKFKEIQLDFTNVDTIGQAFADEIFRVFSNQHPDILILPVNTTKAVDMMIKRVTLNKDENI